MKKSAAGLPGWFANKTGGTTYWLTEVFEQS